MRFKLISPVRELIADAYHLLLPVRANIIVVLLAALAFLKVPQGRDLVIGVGEDAPQWHAHPLSYAGFLLALIYFCLTNWYMPRFLLNCDFPNPKRGTVLSAHVEHFLRLHVPRLLGVAPAGVLALAFLLAIGWRGGEMKLPYIGLALICVGVGLGLYALFFLRRRWLGAPLPGEQRSRGKAYASLADVRADRGAVLGILLFGIPPILLFLAFTINAVETGRIPSLVVVFLGLASLGFFGALLIYFGHRYRLPVLLLIAILAFFSTFNNDDHEVRTIRDHGNKSAAPATVVRDSLDQRLEDWHTLIKNEGTSGQTHPLFIVATEGGGIRAAYWTSLVLSRLEDASMSKDAPEKRMSFSKHVFAISGVSGGSFGGAAFVAFVADPTGEPLAARTHRFMKYDFLSPLVGKMLFPDLLQRFLPVRIPCFDRAHGFEEGWERAWRQEGVATAGNNCFAESFTGLYASAKSRIWLPGLFLNGTNLETGCRIITSSWSFGDESDSTFLETIDGVTEMEADLPLSTAAHNSARFTYFNPPGRYPSGRHVVDGGYFENSGGETAHDILTRVMRKVYAEGWSDVEPRLIIIKNGLVPAKTDEEKQADKDKLRNSHAISELLAPISTLLNTRDAHARLSVGELQAQALLSALLDPHKTGEKPTWVIIPNDEFKLQNRKAIVPLGWTLSESAMSEMKNQIDKGDNGIRASFDEVMHTLRVQ